MKKLGLALLLCTAWALAPAQAQSPVVPSTRATVPIVGGITAALRLVTGKANQSIYVTALLMDGVATATWQFSTGTGTNCGTNTSNLTGAMVSDGSAIALGSGYGAVIVVPQGQDLCITIVTAAAPGVLAYDQF